MSGASHPLTRSCRHAPVEGRVGTWTTRARKWTSKSEKAARRTAEQAGRYAAKGGRQPRATRRNFFGLPLTNGPRTVTFTHKQPLLFLLTLVWPGATRLKPAGKQGCRAPNER